MICEASLESIVKKLKRHPIESSHATVVNYGKREINRILPHRRPLDLIDGITGIDISNQVIRATCVVRANDPVFQGHFPGNPVFPGIYQIEAMGQAALCLAHFVERQSLEVQADTQPVRCLFTRVHHAAFIKLIRPEATLRVLARNLEQDELGATIEAQILSGDDICSLAVLEAHFL